jgi:hypothetical protein
MFQNEILKKSFDKAIGGGMSGSIAMGTQVVSLMWIRTTMNYQYRFGTNTTTALKTLYKDGGILRFYRGFIPALVQGPLARFGDTAANTGMMYYLNNNNSTKDLHVSVKSFFCSSSAALWRIVIMPVDTVKTNMQVNGKNSFNILSKKIKTGGIPVMYNGALAASSATFVGHYPWFFTYNYLNEKLSNYENDLFKQTARNGTIGFCSSLISDTCSNSLRVIKTTKQTHQNNISYIDSAKLVVKSDGIIGLFGRGLKTRIFANGLQSSLFTITWKYFEKKLN